MSRRKGKKRHHGHYCWSCDRCRPNERFSGRGHGRHLCRECAKLGREELRYRQIVRNIERWLAYQDFLPRKRRRYVQQLLGDDDLRLRAWAEELLTGVPLDAQDYEYEEVEPDDLFAEGEIRF